MENDPQCSKNVDKRNEILLRRDEKQLSSLQLICDNRKDLPIILSNISEESPENTSKNDQNSNSSYNLEVTTLKVDSEILKELQKRGQPNVSYHLALQTLVENKLIPRDSYEIKKQLLTLENVENGTSKHNYEQALKGFNFYKMQRDVTFKQRLKIFFLDHDFDASDAFRDLEERHEFIRVVFMMLFAALFFTFAVICIFIFM